MKRYEDALACAWVATEFLGGRARAYGDADVAIWTAAATGAKDFTGELTRRRE